MFNTKESLIYTTNSLISFSCQTAKSRVSFEKCDTAPLAAFTQADERTNERTSEEVFRKQAPRHDTDLPFVEQPLSIVSKLPPPTTLLHFPTYIHIHVRVVTRGKIISNWFLIIFPIHASGVDSEREIRKEEMLRILFLLLSLQVFHRGELNLIP